MQIAPHLNKALQHVKDQLSDLPPGEFTLETNVKPYMSVKRKMEHDRETDPLALSDLVRGRIFFSEQFNADDVLDIIQKLFQEKIKKIEHGDHKSEEHGLVYLGVTHVDLDINGVNFELQIMPIEFQPYKEFLHQIYDKFRNPKTKDKLTDKQKALLQKVHNALYKKIDEMAQSNRRANSSK